MLESPGTSETNKLKKTKSRIRKKLGEKNPELCIHADKKRVGEVFGETTSGSGLPDILSTIYQPIYQNAQNYHKIYQIAITYIK
jgi:hypothetical protein